MSFIEHKKEIINDLKINDKVSSIYRNKQNFYLNLLNKFSIDHSFNGLMNAYKENDRKEIKNYSYKLCSISASLGFEDLYTYSYKIIETDFKNGNIKSLIEDLEKEYNHILNIIKENYEK